jgi:adenylate cyclase
LAGITQFEVHVQQGGRWSIHAQFGSFQKDKAIEEAKSMEPMRSVTAVKVVREIYDPEAGSSQEFVIYKSAGVTSLDKFEQDATTVGGGSGGGGNTSSSSWMDDSDDASEDDGSTAAKSSRKSQKRASGPQKKSTVTQVVVKLLLVALISLTIGGVFTFMTSSLIGGKTLFGIKIAGNTEANLLFVVFIGTLLLSALMMATSLLKKETLVENQPRYRPPAKATKPVRKIKKVKKKRKKYPSPEDKPYKSAKKAASTDADDDALNDRLKSELGSGVDDDDGSGGAKPPPESAAAGGGLSPKEEKQKAFMMKALGKALEGSSFNKKKLDNFNKFGVNLWVAGATEALMQGRDIDAKAASKILADSVQVLGYKKSHAENFAGKYEEYLLQDSRYMQMFQAGRNAMNTFLQDETHISRHLDSSLEEWNKPKQKEEQPRVITVLFTDIAGSTAMTQELGDAGAQEVVRAHNRVVREALTQFRGREVKHTGDGIMASFEQASDGVEAAIAMQRGANSHTQANPNLPLYLKIGINSGEPIQEDNDLFGSTVQMSARIVDKAQKNEIFVSEVVKGICAGKSFQFISRGGYEMKGFDGPVTLWEVDWKRAQAAE